MKPSFADITSDARAQLRWHTLLPAVGLALSYFLALRRLADPEVAGAARIFWAALPVPFFLIVVWDAARRRNRHSEFEIEVARRAASISFHFTICWLFALTLLDAAIGLPRAELGWTEAAMIPLLVYFCVFSWMHRRLFGDG